jgi:hypothetical protein
MAPSAIAEHPLKEEVASPRIMELAPSRPDAKRTVRALEDHREIKPAFQFSKAVLLDENHFKSGSRALKLAVSVLLHVTVITVSIFVGLFFTDTINMKQYAASMLVAPPPPPPPPPPATALSSGLRGLARDSSPPAGCMRRQSFPGKSLKSKRLPWSQTVSAA